MSEATASSSAAGRLVMAQRQPRADEPAAGPAACWSRPRPGSVSSCRSAPGQPVALPDEIFDPSTAHYVIDGHDLVVTPAGGGLVVFDQFFAYPDDPPSLSVQGGPPVTANELMSRADLTGPPAEPVVVAQIPVPDDTESGAGPRAGKIQRRRRRRFPAL